MHVCTPTQLHKKTPIHPPLLYLPVFTQGAPSYLLVVVNDKWIKGLWQMRLQVAGSQP